MYKKGVKVWLNGNVQATVNQVLERGQVEVAHYDQKRGKRELVHSIVSEKQITPRFS